jgi:hypothetical protein
MLVAVAATLMAYASGAQAQVPTLDGNAALPQTIQLPATVRGKNGPPTQTNLDFTINNFTRGKHGTLCAVGTLSGGSTSLPQTPVSIPASTGGDHASPGDCQGGDGEDGHGEHGGFGLLEHGLNATPADATALGIVQPVPFHGVVGGAVVPAQICTILDLILNPIHLDLLGLVVDTSRIRVTITGNPAGGLLGNLLCALLGP